MSSIGLFHIWNGIMENIGLRIKNIRKLLNKSQEELAIKTFEASAGGGAVSVVVTGEKKIKASLL